MIFHFQFSGVRGWEAMGASEGAGTDPLPVAIAELRFLHGGSLPAGHYPCIAAVGNEARWRGFELGDDGEMLN